VTSDAHKATALEAIACRREKFNIWASNKEFTSAFEKFAAAGEL
jgi:hypothetical protein